MLRQHIDDYVNDFFPDSSVVLIDGHDDALIGIGTGRAGDPHPVYDIRKILDKLEETMPAKEAWDYFEKKIQGNSSKKYDAIYLFSFN